jgi:excisionase family DNA binding protein
MVNVGVASGNMIKLDSMPKLPQWESWTVSEAGKETGYNEEYIRRLIRNGDVEAVKVGKIWLIRIASLEKYLKGVEDIDDNRYGPKK